MKIKIIIFILLYLNLLSAAEQSPQAFSNYTLNQIFIDFPEFSSPVQLKTSHCISEDVIVHFCFIILFLMANFTSDIQIKQLIKFGCPILSVAALILSLKDFLDYNDLEDKLSNSVIKNNQMESFYNKEKVRGFVNTVLFTIYGVIGITNLKNPGKKYF